MSETGQTIYFEFGPLWSVTATLSGLLMIGALWSYYRNGRFLGAKRFALAALRFIAVALVLVLLADPHRVNRDSQREAREIALLIDASRSMALRDTPDGRSRWESARDQIEKLSQSSPWSSQFRIYSFGESLQSVDQWDDLEPEAERSNLAEAIDSLMAGERDAPLGAVLVFSDGRLEEPENGATTALKLRRAGIPLYPMAFGDAVERPDLRIDRVQANQVLPYDPQVRLEALISSPGYEGESASIEVRQGNRLLFERKVSLNGGQQEVRCEFDSPFQGFHEYQVTIQELPGERMAGNNRRPFGVELRDEKIRVIYMEGTPNATDILHNALEDDPDMEVTSFFFPQTSNFAAAKEVSYQTDRSGRRIYNVANTFRGFPRTMEDLLNYDVVINSDIYREAFTEEQLENTVRLVEEHGGGFVMVGGQTAFGAGFYDQTVIDKLMPVDVYGAVDSRWSSFQLSIPEEAYSHPIMKVGEDDAETRAAWTERFPGFGGLNVVNRLKPGAVSLAVHASERNQYGPLVVFAVQQIGRGRTMAFTSDTTSGWGAQFERQFGDGRDPIAYYRKFWNNAIRWLAADRIQRKAGELRLRLADAWVRLGETLEVEALVSERLIDQELDLKVIQPDGSESILPWVIDASDGGRRVNFSPTQVGAHRLVARLNQTEGEPLFARQFFDVTQESRELGTTRNDVDTLDKLANGANGVRLEPDGFDALNLDDLFAEVVEFQTRSLWDRWWFLISIAIVLGFEWILRRRWGLA